MIKIKANFIATQF